METHTKKYVYATICGILAVATSFTIIGGIVFGLMGVGFLIQGYEAKHGDRPWWTKSFLTLWRERKSDDAPDDARQSGTDHSDEQVPEADP